MIVTRIVYKDSDLCHCKFMNYHRMAMSDLRVYYASVVNEYGTYFNSTSSPLLHIHKESSFFNWTHRCPPLSLLHSACLETEDTLEIKLFMDQYLQHWMATQMVHHGHTQDTNAVVDGKSSSWSSSFGYTHSVTKRALIVNWMESSSRRMGLNILTYRSLCQSVSWFSPSWRDWYSV